MAIHIEKIGLIKESLIEMMHIAEYAINYKKNDKKKWGDYATGGILGFPSCVVLFSVIDCIGSIFSGDSDYKVLIDQKEKNIRDTSQHIYILNSKYFNLNLEQLDLDNLYKNVRSTITHNSLLPTGYYLLIGENENSPFKIGINENDKRIYFINLIPLFTVTKSAVEIFLDDLNKNKINYLNSKAIVNIKKRDINTPIYMDNSQNMTIKIKRWIKE